MQLIVRSPESAKRSNEATAELHGASNIASIGSLKKNFVVMGRLLPALYHRSWAPIPCLAGTADDLTFWNGGAIVCR